MATGGQADWGADQWCAALSEHFFRPEQALLPVLLLVDEELLARLHPSSDRNLAVSSLCEAVRAGLSPPEPSGYFADLDRRGLRWKLDGGDGHPPFVHLLALCVLAATRMGSGSVAATNYRHHLCTLLGVEDDGSMPAGFRESLYLLWGRLTWWLDERHGGRLGLSTVIEHPHWTHIGYPISQTLFRSADRRQLDDFFRWIGLGPGEEIDEDVLVAHFRAWAPAHDLSTGAERLVSDPELGTALGRILRAYATTWDGTGSRATGGRRAPLRLVVKAHPRLSFSLMAVQPPGFPDRLQGTFAGRTVTAEAEDGVFRMLGSVEPSILTRGLRLGPPGSQLVLEAADAHVLRLDAEIGGWA